MTISLRTLRYLPIVAVATLGLSACTTSAGANGNGGLANAPVPTSSATTTAAAPAPTVTVTATATASPATYFADGKTYDAWILSVNPDGTFTIDIVHHLTGTDAKNYLTSHGQTIPPEGIPDDYINVDTSVKKTVQVSPTVTVTTNEEGVPASVSPSGFVTWLNAHKVMPLAAADMDKYPGAAHYYGPLFAVTFTDDVMSSASQIFEP